MKRLRLKTTPKEKRCTSISLTKDVRTRIQKLMNKHGMTFTDMVEKVFTSDKVNEVLSE